MDGYYVGIDIGGTNVKLAVMGPDRTILSRRAFPTPYESPQRTFALIADQAAEELQHLPAGASARLAGAGVGIPGPVNAHTGYAYRVPALGWYDVNVAGSLSALLGCPVSVENDGNINLLGEMGFGAARGASDVVMLTLGTGLGSGITVCGQVLRGACCMAGEVGHMVLDQQGPLCACGNRGCWESYCSATALLRKARAAPGVLRPDESADTLTVKQIFDRAKAGDAACAALADDFRQYLAMGLTSLIHLFNPELILLGGGISHAGAFLTEPLQRLVNKRLMHPQLQCPIRCGALFEDAGTMGACSLALAARDGQT